MINVTGRVFASARRADRSSLPVVPHPPSETAIVERLRFTPNDLGLNYPRRFSRFARLTSYFLRRPKNKDDMSLADPK